MSRCLQEGDKKLIVLAETWANQLGRRQLMQYAGRQGGTLLVKVALHTHADDTQRGTLHLQRLPGKAALVS